MTRFAKLLAGVALLSAASCPAASSRPSRSVEFTYQFTVSGLPASGGKLQAWAPLPSSNAMQKVWDLKVDSPIPYKEKVEPTFHDRYLYLEKEGGLPSSVTVTVTFKATRLEASRKKGWLDKTKGNLKPELEANRMIPLGGPILKEAKKALKGRGKGESKARLLYDDVVDTMTYDKTEKGWGRGDAAWACDSRRGNCTDFHSLFIGMARSQDIPARFWIGFPLAPTRTAAVIPGYHCWAEFWRPKSGWVPLDASMASLTPAESAKYYGILDPYPFAQAHGFTSRKAFFFGNLDPDRVAFCLGRDLKLSPEPADSPVNIFIYPIVQLNGKAWDKVGHHFSFADLPSPR